MFFSTGNQLRHRLFAGQPMLFASELYEILHFQIFWIQLVYSNLHSSFSYININHPAENKNRRVAPCEDDGIKNRRAVERTCGWMSQRKRIKSSLNFTCGRHAQKDILGEGIGCHFLVVPPFLILDQRTDCIRGDTQCQEPKQDFGSEIGNAEPLLADLWDYLQTGCEWSGARCVSWRSVRER